MARNVIVRGRPRRDVDLTLLVQALLAIAAEWEQGDRQSASPDAFQAAIEDRQVGGAEQAR